MTYSLKLQGRRALVTGGTKGIGAAVVHALCDAGVKVLTTARTTPEHVVDSALFVIADVSTAEGCATVAQAVQERLGGIDITPGARGDAEPATSRVLQPQPTGILGKGLNFRSRPGP